MAREFTNSNNHLVTQLTSFYSGYFAFHAWVYVDGNGGGSLGTILHKGSSVPGDIVIRMNSSGQITFRHSWSTTDGDWNTTSAIIRGNGLACWILRQGQYSKRPLDIFRREF